MLENLGNFISKRPVKLILTTLLIIVIFLFGVSKIFMATGNDTLVDKHTDVYKNNLKLEEEFGGESIVVLYEAEDLLTTENFEHMKGLERVLEKNQSVYSLMSPVTIIEQVTEKQAEKFQEALTEMIVGLASMGENLLGIANEIENNSSQVKEPNLEIPIQEELSLPEYKTPELSNLNNLREELGKINEVFSQLITSQDNLGSGTSDLITGYQQISNKILEIVTSLDDLGPQLEDLPREAKQIEQINSNLETLALEMADISNKSSQLREISNKSVQGLEAIKDNLNKKINEQASQQEKLIKKQENNKTELRSRMEAEKDQKEREMQEIQKKLEDKQSEQSSQLTKLSEGLGEMGSNLIMMGENLSKVQDYSDIMEAGLPKSDKSLNNILYEDQELRPAFDDLIVQDEAMLMMIRFAANISDNEKSETIDLINDYLDRERIDGLDVLVSGKAVLDSSIRGAMQESIQKMMALALIIMVLILMIIFKVNWRLMPLVTVLLAVIGTIGFMGWFKIPITMVSMAVFPILIGLGIDYAIQFQNRYSEELLKGGQTSE